MTPQRSTYLLIDGENIDATLGSSILGRRPHPDERPRWDRLLSFAEQRWGQPTKGLFFLAANNDLPLPFIQAITAMGYRPIPLSGAGKVVDIAIQRTLEALVERDDDVMLASHDGDFVEQLRGVLDGERRVGLIAFEELCSVALRGLREEGMELYDLEHEIGAFNVTLPRLRIIPIEQFDPQLFL